MKILKKLVNQILFYSDDMVDTVHFVNTPGLKMSTVIRVLQVKIHVQKAEMLAGFIKAQIINIGYYKHIKIHLQTLTKVFCFT